MLTTGYHAFEEGGREGFAQLKWWSQAGMLIVKVVELLPQGGEPRGVVTSTSREFLRQRGGDFGLRCVRLEAVLSSELLRRLEKSGWEVTNGNCADMTV